MSPSYLLHFKWVILFRLTKPRTFGTQLHLFSLMVILWQKKFNLCLFSGNTMNFDSLQFHVNELLNTISSRPETKIAWRRLSAKQVQCLQGDIMTGGQIYHWYTSCLVLVQYVDTAAMFTLYSTALWPTYLARGDICLPPRDFWLFEPKIWV